METVFKNRVCQAFEPNKFAKLASPVRCRKQGEVLCEDYNGRKCILCLKHSVELAIDKTITSKMSRVDDPYRDGELYERAKEIANGAPLSSIHLMKVWEERLLQEKLSESSAKQ